MLVGTAYENITPDGLLPLMGQMYERIAQYTRDPLTANAVVFDDGTRRVAIVSVDVCVLPEEFLRSVQAACAAEHGIAAQDVIIAATHTHVGPLTTDRFIGKAAPEYMDKLHAHLVSVVGRALADREECEIFAGAGYAEQMGWNRRGMRRDGSCHMYWGSWKEDFVGLEGPRDGQVPVLFARKVDGPIKVVIPSFATHPNSLEHGTYYSADVPGEVRRVLRGAFGEEVGVVYLTGAAGNTAPSIMESNPDHKQPWRNETGVVRSGWYLGGEILKVIAQQIEPMAEPVLRHAWTQLDIAMRAWDSWCDPADYGSGMREYFEDSRNRWAEIMAESNPVPVRVHVVRVGDAAICFNPAELYVEFGLAIKGHSPARTTLVGELSDGYCGYVPIPEGIRHGGYSAASSSNTRLAPEAGWMIVEETGQLLNQVFAGPGA